MSTLTATHGPERQSVDAWFSPGRFSLLLGLLILAQYPDLVLGTHSLFFRDFGHFGYPNAVHVRASFWNAELPLWNPLNHCGIPFLAQWNTLALYPGSLLYVLLPLPWSLNLFSLLHLALGGLGMYCLARRRVGSGLAASLAGLAFTFNGVMMNAVMWPSIISALGLAPWVMASAIAAWRRGGRWVAWAAVLGAAQMLTGGVEVILSTWLVLGLLGLVDGLAGRWSRGRALARCGSVILLVSLLSAIQLLPFLQLLAGSERSEISAGSLSAMPGYGWANFLIPLFGTLKSSTGLPFQPGQFWLTSYYLGIGTVTFALAALILRPNRRRVVLGAAVLLFLVLALGDRGLLYGWLLHTFPVLGVLRYPVKFVLPVVLLVPLLVAETGRWLSVGPASDSRPFRRRLLGVIAFVGLATVALAAVAPTFQKLPALVQETRFNALLRLGFLGVLGALAFIVTTSTSRRRTLGGGLALLLVGWLDVLTHAPKQAPTVASDALWMAMAPHRAMSESPRPGINRALLSRHALAVFDRTQLADSARSYLGLRLGLYCNCNLLEDIPKIDGFYPLVPRYHARLVDKLYNSPSVPESLLDLLGASQITAPNSVTDWQARPSWLPLVTGGQTPVWCDDRSALARLFAPEFDPRREILLPDATRADLPAVRPGQPVLQMTHFSPHTLRFACESEHPALISIAQSYYPTWRATVDGEPTRIWRANLAFQAVAVPAGRHEVRLTCRDRPFQVGAGLTLLTTVALLGFVKRRSG